MGLIPKSCTTYALVSMIHNWHVSSDGKAAAIRVVLFDFGKAWLFLIMTNDLNAGEAGMWKFFDDTTVSKVVDIG